MHVWFKGTPADKALGKIAQSPINYIVNSYFVVVKWCWTLGQFKLHRTREKLSLTATVIFGVSLT